jgi:hypothetical protein
MKLWLRKDNKTWNLHCDLTIVEARVFVTGVLLANRLTGAICVGCWTRPDRVGILNMNIFKWDFCKNSQTLTEVV